MNEPQDHENTPHQEPAESDSRPGPDSSGDGYLEHVRQVFMAPDAYFRDSAAASRTFGLISTGIFLGLLFVQSLITRVTRFSSWRFEFEYLIQAFKVALAIAIPMAALVFVLKWYGDRDNQGHSLDFHIGKFGAMLLLPCLLLAVAIPLNILDVAIGSWLRGLSITFVYLAVFLMAYLYAAPGKLKAAVVFTAGFYLAYRLLLLLF